MKEPSGVIQLWFERKQSFTKEIIPYIRYMMMSGLPVFYHCLAFYLSIGM